MERDKTTQTRTVTDASQGSPHCFKDDLLDEQDITKDATAGCCDLCPITMRCTSSIPCSVSCGLCLCLGWGTIADCGAPYFPWRRKRGVVVLVLDRTLRSAVGVEQGMRLAVAIIEVPGEA
ncbi:hypothetical protein GQ607_009325 [Colletotrichum asianum]|uniref:Uncharacterized protein n=1 Tax=Colletotrichum asianum TaxID=702518 RepID=A0A8H3W8T2_9PEZI|nr:hypothetical protein GQ607_009325 [Colletotrichum asianum]